MVAAIFPLLVMRFGPATFDFDSRAASVDSILSRLSTQTGEHLRASRQIGREILFVHAHSVEWKELKTRLAAAAAADWTKDGADEVLKRTPAIDKLLWSEHVATRRKLVDEAMKLARKRLEEKFDAKVLANGLAALGSQPVDRNDPNSARRQYEAQKSLFAKGPLARLLDRLVLACSPDDLAAVGPFDRRVFRLRPTQMQRGLDPSAFRAAIDAFRSEQQDWIDAARTVDFGEDREGRMVSDPRAQLDIAPESQDFYLDVRRGEMTALFNVNLMGGSSGPAGFPILCQESFADPARVWLDAQSQNPGAGKDDPVVELSPDSQEFQRALMGAFMGRSPSPVSDRMRALMIGVVEEDPLSWMASDVLSAYGKAAGDNVVAALPDEALSTIAFMARDQALHLNQTMDGLIQSGTIRNTVRGGWAQIEPGDRVEAEIGFTPRRAAADLIRARLTAGHLDIRTYAKFAFESKLRNRGSFADWFLGMIDPSELGASDRTDWKALQLFGSFSTEQQKALEAGASFSVSSMTPDQRAIVERIVYGNLLDGDARVPGGGVVHQINIVEPSASFGQGLPGAGLVTAQSRTNPVIVAYGESGPQRSLDPYTLASVELEIKGHPDQMARYGVSGLKGYAIGGDKTLTMKVEPAPGVYRTLSITVPDYDPAAKPVSWDQLPDTYRKQIEAAMTQVRARITNQPGQKIPPLKP